MKLYVFRSGVTNFGDELNNWLLPRVFPNFFDEDDLIRFLGIGSVLFDNTHPEGSIKIVFGSGYGGYTKLPVFDDKWRFYCVRGPRTAEACGLPSSKVAGDTAILINNYRANQATKMIRASFMPHWESVPRGNWQEACGLAGIHYLDPSRPVDELLAEIEASSIVITEAMHGAIVADALRVPWIPVFPFQRSHHMKWHDWAESLDVKLAHYRAWPSSLHEAWVARKQAYAVGFVYPSRARKVAMRLADPMFVRLAARSLKVASRQAPTLSSDTALARSIDRLEEAARVIRTDFPGS